MKKGFTLAEILITIGIIGVVAAITLPILIQNYQKYTTASRLKKFYTNINQAIKLSEAANGFCDEWPVTNDTTLIDNYIVPYFKGVKEIKSIIDPTTNYSYNYVVLADGSAIKYRYSGGYDITFYINANKLLNPDKKWRESFSFELNKLHTNDPSCSIEPYTLRWNGTRSGLLTNMRYGCVKGSMFYSYCAKLIQIDGWKISKDYPW